MIHALVRDKDRIQKDLSIVNKLKLIKNNSEIELGKQVHLKDSAVLCEFFYKLDSHFTHHSSTSLNHFENVKELNEYEVAEYLDNMRSKVDGFFAPSFETICGFGENGAIIHYKPKNDGSAKILQANNMFLVDSGGHYFNLGTTDVTRTVFLGDKTQIKDYQRECFTRVLKGHIQLAMKIFPSGTSPELLDSFARYNLWSVGLDYGHGTGHGVGALLNVHEIPPVIAWRKSPEFGGIQENMIITNEPGYYEQGNFGIRIENCYLTLKQETKYTGTKKFLRFESLTYVPIQLDLINRNLLDKDELEWLNNYHAKCFELVGPLLQAANKNEVYEWLREQTRPL
jgi:Xaa-Pro aminopeptidase